MEGFAKIRRGLLDHLRLGKLSLIEFAVYLLIHMRADFETGIYEGCALTIAYQMGQPKRLKSFQGALSRLRKKRYVNYATGAGKRGAYPILIHKYEPTVGRWLGFRLDAWKHGAKCEPEYVRDGGDAAEARLTGGSDAAEARPNKETRTKNQDYSEIPLEKRTTEDLMVMKRTWTRGGAKCPQGILDELKKRGVELIVPEGVTIHAAVAIPSRGPERIDKPTVMVLQKLIRTYQRRGSRRRFAIGVKSLAWASRNLGRRIYSLSGLRYREAAKLMSIMVGERKDNYRPKRQQAVNRKQREAEK